MLPLITLLTRTGTRSNGKKSRSKSRNCDRLNRVESHSRHNKISMALSPCVIVVYESCPKLQPSNCGELAEAHLNLMWSKRNGSSHHGYGLGRRTGGADNEPRTEH